MRIAASFALLACASACAMSPDDDPGEDLGELGGKADKITTRNVTLRAHLSSGAPSHRTFSVTTAEGFRASIGYSDGAQTRIIISDDSGTLAESPVTWQPTVVVPPVATPRTLHVVLENTSDAPVAVRLHVATTEARHLKIATFNIRWYGIGGDVDHPAAETRNPTLKAFVDNNLDDADLIMFEEITDPAMLAAEVVPAGWTCSTYANATPMHQFVVGCLAPGLVLTHEADDDDIGYQPLALGTLRPGVAGIVRDASTLAPVARIMGVHLKALPDSTDKRLQQAKILVDRFASLATRNEQLPLLVLGDFNAHRAIDTHRDKDDWDLIAGVFDTHPELGLVHVEHDYENTYRDKEGKAYKLDHMYLGGAKVEGVDVIGPCNDAWPADQVAISKHFDEISDHCPVVANVVVH
ncbi:MAG TPA: hypothetical protein VL326_20450 [Kofleriaceae bacterium]|jgi:hypothetical protein|nr:hypothetical protein [Kofleriaceae bacterium]